jgi:hypothetical protein
MERPECRSVVGVEPLRYTESCDGLGQSVDQCDDSFRGVEVGVHHKACGIVDDGQQVELLGGLASLAHGGSMEEVGGPHLPEVVIGKCPGLFRGLGRDLAPPLKSTGPYGAVDGRSRRSASVPLLALTQQGQEPQRGQGREFLSQLGQCLDHLFGNLGLTLVTTSSVRQCQYAAFSVSVDPVAKRLGGDGARASGRIDPLLGRGILKPLSQARFGGRGVQEGADDAVPP